MHTATAEEIVKERDATKNPKDDKQIIWLMLETANNGKGIREKDRHEGISTPYHKAY